MRIYNSKWSWWSSYSIKSWSCCYKWGGDIFKLGFGGIIWVLEFKNSGSLILLKSIFILLLLISLLDCINGIDWIEIGVIKDGDGVPANPISSSLSAIYGLALQDINNKDVRAKNSYFRHLDPLIWILLKVNC